MENRLHGHIDGADAVRMAAADDFDALVTEALRAPVEGWRFPFLAERIRVDESAWDYSATARELMQAADRVLDHGTGGGEVLSELGLPRRLLIATEAHPPNVPVAAARLAPKGIPVVQIHGGTFNINGPNGDDGRPEWRLPLGDESFDLVLARNVAFCAAEAYRVLRPGGRLLHQTGRIGKRRPGEIELRDHFPGAEGPGWPHWSVADDLATAGFELDEYREQLQRTHYLDIAAVVFQLRATPWTIPGFTVESYRDQLRKLHADIQQNGSLVTAGTALLAIATKPSRTGAVRDAPSAVPPRR